MSQLSFKQEPGVLVVSLVATVFVVCVIGFLAKKALAQVTEITTDDAGAPHAGS
jgi:hypothetical protein